MQLLTKALASVGVVSIVLVIVGLAIDVSNFDTTSGGYEPPYADFVGEPIDWHSLDRTATGVVGRGLIMNTHVNATTGMISFEIYGQMINFRPLSERAIVVHKPREAFVEMGFQPEF
jgi:hypothetical protein